MPSSVTRKGSGLGKDSLQVLSLKYETLAISSMSVVRDENLTTLDVAHLYVEGTVSLPDGSITNAMLAEGSVTLASAGGEQSIVYEGLGPDLAVVGLTAGTNITLVPSIDGTYVTVNASGTLGVSSVTNAEGSGDDLVTGTVTNPVIKQLVGGTNVTLTPSVDGTNITINAVGGAGEVVSVTNAIGSGEDLVTGTEANPVIKQLVGGANVTLTPSIDGTNITISATGGGGRWS